MPAPVSAQQAVSITGTVDPSAGGGVVGTLGQLYYRTLGGSIQLWQKTSAPDTGWTRFATSGGSVTVFRYTVTGVEPDLSDFFITLPAARANDTYRIVGQCAGVASIIPFDLPDIAAGDRTTTQFRLIASSVFTAGDKLDFIVADDQ